MNKSITGIDDEVMSKLTLAQLPLYAALMAHKTPDDAPLNFTQLKALTADQPSDTELVHRLLDMNTRLLRVSLTHKGHGYHQVPPFTTFSIDTTHKQVNVTVNPEWIFSRTTTPQESKEHPSYAKKFYRLLNAHSHGVWKVSVEELRHLLGVPDSYSLPNFTQHVLVPTVWQVHPVVRVTMKRVYRRIPGKQGRGNLVGFEFYSAKEDM